MVLFLLICTGMLWGQSKKYKGKSPEEIARWDHKIEVKSGEEKFDNEKFHAYSIDVFDTDKPFVLSCLEKEVRERSDERKIKKNIVSGLQVGLPSLKEEATDVRARVEELSGRDDVRVAVSFFDGGKAINPADFPEGDKAARQIMTNLSLILNKAVVQDELDEATEELDDMKAGLEKKVSDTEKLESQADQNQEKANAARSEQAKTQEKLAKSKSKVIELEMKYGSNPNSKELKKISKAKKDMEKYEKQLKSQKKDELKYTQKAGDLQGDVPDYQASKEELEKAIAEQEKIVEALKKKLEAVR